jgi:hypothetical protein
MTGSLLSSTNGNIDITATEANITAGESTYQNESGSKSGTVGVSYGTNGMGYHASYDQSDSYVLSNTHTNSVISAENGTFNLDTSGDTNMRGGNIVAQDVAMDVGGDLNMETLQDTYEQQGSSFGLGIGGGKGSPAYLNNITASAGLTDIYRQTTGTATGIVELSSNDSSLSEAENLDNLLDSSSINVTGSVDNQTVKENIDFTDADFEGSISVNTKLLTAEGRKEIADAYKNLPENLEKTAKGVAGAVVDGYNKISNNIRAITTPVPPTLKVNDNYSDAFKSAIAAGATPEQAQKVVEAISSTIDIAVAGRQTASNTISESSKQSDQLSSNNGVLSITVNPKATTQTIVVGSAVKVDQALQQFASKNPELAYFAYAASKPSIAGLIQVGGGMVVNAFLGGVKDQAIKDKIADPLIQSSQRDTPQKIVGDEQKGIHISDTTKNQTEQSYNQQLNSITNLTNIVLGGAIGKAGSKVGVRKNASNNTRSDKTYQTYTKENPQTGQVYCGRTSGCGTPERNVAKRDSSHHKNDEGYAPAKLDQSSSNSNAIRGREQQLIDNQVQQGNSGNSINGISQKNPNRQRYLDAAEDEFGK